MKYKGTYDIYRLVRHRFAWIVREIHVGRYTQDFDTHPTGARNPKDEADGWISGEYRT